MRANGLRLILLGALLLAGCSKGPQGPTATVALRDGTSFTGAVTKSDTTAITMTSPSGETRTYPMAQVDGITYANGSGVPVAADTATTSEPVIATPASTSAAPPPPPAPASAPVAPVATTAASIVEPRRTIAAGTRIHVRNSDRIQAGQAEVGQPFPAVIVSDVMGVDGGLAIPKGSDATLVVRQSVAQGKIQGRSEIALDLASVRVRGRRYNLQTRDFVEQGTQGVGKNKRSASFIGGGAALGAIIGAVAGGGKGAAIGAAAGAGGGVAAQSLTRGKSVSVPAESVLSFDLEAPVEIRLVN